MCKNGFTLLELLVSIGMIALLAFIAYPMYRSYQSNHAALYAAYLFASDWREMKERANMITSPCGLYITSKRRYDVYDTDPNLGLSQNRNRKRIVDFGSLFGKTVEIINLSVGSDIRIVPGVIDGTKDTSYFKGDIVFASGASSHVATISNSGEITVK